MIDSARGQRLFKKLLAIAADPSATAAERENALRHAQELSDRFESEWAANPTRVAGDFVERSVFECSRLSDHQEIMAMSYLLRNHFHASLIVVRWPRDRVVLVARPFQIDLAEHVFIVVCRCLKRFARIERIARRNLKTFYSSAVWSLHEKLHEAKRRNPCATNALVRSDAEREQYVEDRTGGRQSKTKPFHADREAMLAGAHAGRQIELHTPLRDRAAHAAARSSLEFTPSRN